MKIWILFLLFLLSKCDILYVSEVLWIKDQNKCN